MIEKFTEYTTKIIEMTCGFTPVIKVKELSPESIQIFIEGTPDQRALIMGKNANNLKAFERLLRIVARRNNIFIYVYVKPMDKIEEQLQKIKDLNIFL